jgi:hypothetical protein
MRTIVKLHTNTREYLLQLGTNVCARRTSWALRVDAREASPRQSRQRG